MKAKYTPSAIYPGNPFVEALPPMLDDTALIRELMLLPKRDDDIREKVQTDRMQYTAILNQVFVPPIMSMPLYYMIYQGITASLACKTSIASAQQSTWLYNGKQIGNSVYRESTSSFSLLGEPGIGKTTTVTRILQTIPQVIEHEQYAGEPLYCKQVNYLCIQCPSDCSVKGMCIAIFAELDRLIGTEYAKARMTTYTMDTIIVKLSQLCITHHVGIIVIDEIQNVMFSRNKRMADSTLIRTIVQLMNDTGVCVMLVGTPEVRPLLDEAPHLARRTRGLYLSALDYGEEFLELLSVLWKYLCIRNAAPLSEPIRQTLYTLSGGIPARLVQILVYAQQYAISTGAENLTPDVLRKTCNMYRLDYSVDHQTTGMKEITPCVRQQDAPHAPEKGRPRKNMGVLLEAFSKAPESFETWLAEQGMIEWM